jgi:Ribbon-helix-helix protein, copG family
MKRLQIMIDDDAYDALDAEAARTHVSKASLIRHYVHLGLRPLPTLGEDPLTALTASASFKPADIDETVYGS